jgi:hypothetical protein
MWHERAGDCLLCGLRNPIRGWLVLGRIEPVETNQ